MQKLCFSEECKCWVCIHTALDNRILEKEREIVSWLFIFYLVHLPLVTDSMLEYHCSIGFCSTIVIYFDTTSNPFVNNTNCCTLHSSESTWRNSASVNCSLRTAKIGSMITDQPHLGEKKGWVHMATKLTYQTDRTQTHKFWPNLEVKLTIKYTLHIFPPTNLL